MPEGAPDLKIPPPNIHSFLFKVGIMEIRYIRMLANLCSLTYTMARMTVSCFDTMQESWIFPNLIAKFSPITVYTT